MSRLKASLDGKFDLIGIDADDTLWHTENTYREVEQRYTELLAPYAPAELVMQTFHATEIRNLDVFGYGLKGFLLSLVEAAIELSAGRISGDQVGLILELGKQMAAAELPLVEGAEHSLRQLASRYRLALITKGDPLEQEAKIKRSGLEGYFERVEIVSDKTSQTYARILERCQVPPERFLMAGNSLRSDILPVLELGGQAVHIPHPLTWAHEHAHIPEQMHSRFHRLDHIGLLPELVARLDGSQV